MTTPTDEQMAALRSFAQRYGRNWKAALRTKWRLGTDDREPNGGHLRRLRNTLGPRWLVDFKFPEDA